jgi:hypothetical protein
LSGLYRVCPPLLLHSSIFGQTPSSKASQGSSRFVMTRPTRVLRPATHMVPYPSSAFAVSLDQVRRALLSTLVCVHLHGLQSKR